MRTAFARLAMLAFVALSGACLPASPTAPVDPYAVSEGEYAIRTANDVAMPGTLSFADGVRFTYSGSTRIRLAQRKYEMVLDYVATDANGSYPWVWKMAGSYEIRGDTVVLDPNGGDWNGKALTLRNGALTMRFEPEAGQQQQQPRVRTMVFAR